MKVLVLNGSPRAKSNTMLIANEFFEGFKEKRPDAEIEIIDLKKYDIQPCRGCFSCWVRTPGECIIKDDMSKTIIRKIGEADIVAWCIPLYFFALPSHAKACMDRTLPGVLPYIIPGGTGHPRRYKKEGKCLVISNCGFCDEKIFEPMDAMFSYSFGEHETLYRTTGELFGQETLKNMVAPAFAAIRQCGREYAETGKISDATKKETLKPIIPADMFVKSANENWDRQIAAAKFKNS